MNITRAKKREAILVIVRELSLSYGVKEPVILFGMKHTQYNTGTHEISMDGRAYNATGRTLIYHEFAHHLCNTQYGMPQANHTGAFWRTLDDICERFAVNYPWRLEYVSGVQYYERNIIPRLPPRKRARALHQASEYSRLSKAA